MSSAKSSWSKWSSVSVAFLALAAFALPALGQEAAETSAPGGSYVDDWSHHHLVFSNPGTREDAVKNGTLDKWLKITSDPRYQLQLAKRKMGALPVVADPNAATADRNLDTKTVDAVGGMAARPVAPARPRPVPENPIEKDWSQSLGGSTTSLEVTLAAGSSTTVGPTSTITVGTQTFTTSQPETASGTIAIGSANCIAPGTGVAINGVDITTSATGENATLTISSDPGAGTKVVVPGGTGGTTYEFETTCSTQTNCVKDAGTGSPNHILSAKNLAAAINNNPADCGSTAPCFANVSAANSTVYATNPGTDVTTVTDLCAGSAFTFTRPTSTAGTGGTALSVGTLNVGGNGTTTGATFAIGSSNVNTASQMVTAIGNETATDFVTASNSSGASATVTLSGENAGAADNVSLATYGTAGSAGAPAPADLTLSGSTLTGGTNGPGDTATTFNYWNGTGYDTGSQLATDLHDALLANSIVTTTDKIATTNANPITFSTTDAGAGPFPISAQNFSAFPGQGSISEAAVTAAVQPNAYPAKYGASLTSASCTNDFVVYPTGEAGGTAAPTIIAYNNLYSSCTGTVPSVLWAYNTGAGYSVTTSPILSLDGSKVAFIQSNGTNADLVVVKLAPGGTLASPVAPASSGNITTCTPAPCMTVTALGHNDTYSSPFYDYSGSPGDILWVGDNSGNLEAFSGVFYGAVAPSGTVALGSNAVSSPVLDTVSGYIFVGDMGGTLYSVGSGTTVGAPAGVVHGNTGVIADAFADAPLVDSNTGRVFAFANQSKTAVYTGDNVVFGLTTAFTNATGIGTSPITETVDNGATGHYLYAGGFDNVYFQSGTGTGNIYAVGDTGLTTGASLYRIGLSAGNLIGGSAVTQAATGLSDGYAWPSPLTEFCNGACTVTTGGTCGTGVTCTNSGTDYVFFSVNQGAKEGCTTTAGNGCIMSYNVSNPGTVSTPIAAVFSGAQNYPNVGTIGCWATGGIVIDNDASTTGASEIYFTSLNGAEAVNPGSACSAGSPATINAIQAEQNAP